jgi:hypothetical protein
VEKEQPDLKVQPLSLRVDMDQGAVVRAILTVLGVTGKEFQLEFDRNDPERIRQLLQSLARTLDPKYFNSCMISYSHKDEEFVKRLTSRLDKSGVNVWNAGEDIQGGRKLHEQIYEAILAHDKLLIVLSTESMKSQWVMSELRRARKEERETSKRKLFPIRLVDFDTIRRWECFDADTGKDLAIEVREYFIPDFSNWHNKVAFDKAIKGLLEDLRAASKSG